MVENGRVSRRLRERGATAMVARVEWRSERRWAETPRALLIGGERVEVEVVDRWTEGPAEAGGETHRCFVVVDGSGRTFRVRHGSQGRTVVEMLPELAVSPDKSGGENGGAR